MIFKVFQNHLGCVEMDADQAVVFRVHLRDDWMNLRKLRAPDLQRTYPGNQRYLG
jgi:hypothetical protein